jgi:hypothetical protein
VTDAVSIFRLQREAELLVARRERRVRALAAQVESLNPPEREVLAAAGEILQKIVHRMQMDAQ